MNTQLVKELIQKELDKIAHEVMCINGTENITHRSNIIYSVGKIEGILDSFDKVVS